MATEIIKTTVANVLLTKYTSTNWNYRLGGGQDILYFEDGLELSNYVVITKDTVEIDIYDFNTNKQLGILILDYATSNVIKYKIYDILLKRELIYQYEYEDDTKQGE